MSNFPKLIIIIHNTFHQFLKEKFEFYLGSELEDTALIRFQLYSRKYY